MGRKVVDWVAQPWDLDFGSKCALCPVNRAIRGGQPSLTGLVLFVKAELQDSLLQT